MKRPLGKRNLEDRLSLRIVSYFSANPGDELRTDDIALKFDLPTDDREAMRLVARLRRSVLCGLLAYSKDETVFPPRNVYRAGPVLLGWLGLS